MFSAKLFNKFTLILAIMFFLSVTISTITDIQNDYYIQLEFNQLLDEVNTFNNNHLTLLEGVEEYTPTEEYVEYGSGNEALIDGYNNIDNATSYYSESAGTLSTVILGMPLNIQINFTTVKYENGDMLYEIVARETSDTFGGRTGATTFFYSTETNKVYRNFTWNIQYINGKWSPVFSYNWTPMTLEYFILNYWGNPSEVLYKIDSTTTVEELFYRNTITSDTDYNYEYHVKYKLNPVHSIKTFSKFITEVLNAIENGLIKSLSFKEVTVSAVINYDGHIKTMKMNQNIDFLIYIRKFNVDFSKNCSLDVVYLYSLYNQNIPYARPNIPNL